MDSSTTVKLARSRDTLAPAALAAFKAASINSSLKSRYPSIEKPTYVGLMNPNTKNGVMIFSSKCASLKDNDKDSVLDFLTAKLFSGGGPHSFFNKTWQAGLAYSNGVSSGEKSGRMMYYAERCPDIATTMRFVVEQLKEAPSDPRLGEYAVAQAFAANRASFEDFIGFWSLVASCRLSS